MNKITSHCLKLQKTPSETNVPKGSFVYLRICFQVKEIRALGGLPGERWKNSSRQKQKYDIRQCQNLIVTPWWVVLAV
jgi:hypothetical protein